MELQSMKRVTEDVKNINASMGDLKSNLESMHESALKIIEMCKVYKEQSK